MAEATKQKKPSVFDIQVNVDFQIHVSSGGFPEAEHSFTVKQDTMKRDEYRNRLQRLPKS